MCNCADRKPGRLHPVIRNTVAASDLGGKLQKVCFRVRLLANSVLRSAREHEGPALNSSVTSPAKSQSFGLHVTYLLNALLASLAWLYFVSHGFTANGIVDGVYEIQAAMLSQARLSIVPGPLEKFYHDVLMYWGQYYFYQGMLPSVILLVLIRMFGRLAAHYVLVFGFLFVFVYFYQRIIARILECSSRDNPVTDRSLAVCAILLTWLLLFVIPYPHDLGWFFGRFTVYEQQILFGLALAVPGLYFLITGIEQRRSGPIALAVTFFALASWTRVTWFPSSLVILIVAWMLFRKWRKACETYRSRRRDALLLAASLILVLGVLLVNYVRFDSPLNFGVTYMNSQAYVYFRNIMMFFSPLTKLWNSLFNIASYFAPPQLVEQLGLTARSFSRCEGFPPSFFYFNPQFLPLAALLPLALYKTIKERNPMAWWLGILAAATLYLNVILGFLGNFVILRYFMEFYYLLIVVFLAVLLSLVRLRYGLPIFALMLALHIPATARDFRNWWPELRTADAGDGLRITSPKGMTPFILPNAVWPTATFSAAKLPRTPRYAVMGVDLGPDGTLWGRDIFAVYLVPGINDDKTFSSMLEIRGLRALYEKGEALIFLENRLLRSQSISTDRDVDARVELPFVLSATSPYQVMVVFLPEGQSYLPGRTLGTPQVALREVTLKIPSHPGASGSVSRDPNCTKAK